MLTRRAIDALICLTCASTCVLSTNSNRHSRMATAQFTRELRERFGRSARPAQNVCAGKLASGRHEYLRLTLPVIPCPQLRVGNRLSLNRSLKQRRLQNGGPAMKALPIPNAIRFREARRRTVVVPIARRQKKRIGRESKLPFKKPLNCNIERNFSLETLDAFAVRKMLRHRANRKYRGRGAFRGLLLMADLLTSFGVLLEERLSKAANRFVSLQRSRGLTSRSFLPDRTGCGAFHTSFRGVSNIEVYDHFIFPPWPACVISRISRIHGGAYSSRESVLA